MEFEAQTALVTGAAGAIGKGIAAAYCKTGLKVFITDLEQQAVDRTIGEITAAGALVKRL